MNRKTPLEVRVIAQHPPGGRCTLYASYAEVLSGFMAVSMKLVVSTHRDAHGQGFPSLWLGGQPVHPADGVILMPADLCTALEALGHPDDAMVGLAEALEAPLERLLEEQG
jgi:cystathionine gamma-synthase